MLTKLFRYTKPDKKPSDWPHSTRWPLPKNIYIKEIIPLRYVIRDRTTKKITKIIPQDQYQKQIIRQKQIVERLPPVFVLSNGVRVQGTLPIQYIQSKNVWEVLMENWVIKMPSLFSTTMYRSAFLTFSDKRLTKQHSYPLPNGVDKPTTPCLWFGIGLNWLDSNITTDMSYSYFYQIRIKDSVEKISGKQLKHVMPEMPNHGRILILRDKKDSEVFKATFINPKWLLYTEMGIYKIDWKRVGTQFCGIINYVPQYFSSWDAKSGCIWDIKYIDLDLVGTKRKHT